MLCYFYQYIFACNMYLVAVYTSNINTYGNLTFVCLWNVNPLHVTCFVLLGPDSKTCPPNGSSKYV